MILVTGGTGFIGSHTVIELMGAGHKVLILDNLSNSSVVVLDRLEAICGQRPKFVEGDIRDTALLGKLFSEHDIQAVVHFAGLKAVGESIEKPIEYYDNNVRGTLELLSVMKNNGVKRLVFSSSATVYGDPASTPIDESFPRSATNPYGRSKLMIEEMLEDLLVSDSSWRIACLRYFNPVGAHKSGTIGEDPQGIPNNLMPYISQVAVGRREKLSVFGGDYPTPDGTGVRDYIHVVDLAQGHVAALNYLEKNEGLTTVNLGTGIGVSVFDAVRAFEKASGCAVPYEIVSRRPGDVASCWANPERAARLLGWTAERGLDEMCDDAWRWQSQNPEGF